MLAEDAMRGARIIAGADGLDRPVRRLNVMTVPNIVRWTKQDEFLLTTGYPLPRRSEEFCQLIEQLAGNGLAGLGVKLDEYLAEVPPAAVELADRAAFPIVVIPPTSPLDDVLSQTFETIVNRQAAALARRQQIHDAFLGIALTGGGLARLSDELAEVLPGADVVICDPTGYPLAATTRPGAPAGGFRDASGLVDTARLAAGVHSDDESGTHWAAAVIRAGDMRYGFVLAVGGAQGLPGVAGWRSSRRRWWPRWRSPGPGRARGRAAVRVERAARPGHRHGGRHGPRAGAGRQVRLGPAAAAGRAGGPAQSGEHGTPSGRGRGTPAGGPPAGGRRAAGGGAVDPGRSGTRTGTPRWPGSPPSSSPWWACRRGGDRAARCTRT